MDINLPLLLFIGVAGTGAVALADLVFYRRKRLAAIAAVDSQFDMMPEEKKLEDYRYIAAMDQVSQEPALIEYSKSFFPVLLLVFVLRSFMVEPFQIPSESMVPTLEVGDFILVNKFSYGIRLPLMRSKIVDISDPKRGDVMVFFPPHEKRYFIKRVIGLPGDTVRVKDNVLFINGEKMEQTFAYNDNREETDCSDIGGSYVVMEESLGDNPHAMRQCVAKSRMPSDRVWELQEGHYFMMGDNRDNSSDSRVWGPVPEERIVGKAFAIWMHWESLVSIPSFSRVGSI